MRQMEFQFPEKKKHESLYDWVCSLKLRVSDYYLVPDGRHGYRKVYREKS